MHIILRTCSLIIADVVSEPVTLPLVTVKVKAFGIMSKTRMLMSLTSSCSLAMEVPDTTPPFLRWRGHPRNRSFCPKSAKGSALGFRVSALNATFTWKRVERSPPSRGHTQL